MILTTILREHAKKNNNNKNKLCKQGLRILVLLSSTNNICYLPIKLKDIYNKISKFYIIDIKCYQR